MYLKSCKYINNNMPSKVKTNRTTYMRNYMYYYRLSGDKYYQSRKHYINQKVACPCCNKLISRQNVKRHIKTQHQS